jgi:uncharacterized protein YheU (UPF0270 family)
MTDEIEVIRIDGEAPGAEDAEEGIEIPPERVDPALLQRMLAAFVSREWSDGDGDPETRIEEVRRQLKAGRARIVYDFRTESWNIVERR